MIIYLIQSGKYSFAFIIQNVIQSLVLAGTGIIFLSQEISEFLWQEHNLFSLSQEVDLLQENILNMTLGVLCFSCHRKFISCYKQYSFIHRKNVLWHEGVSFNSVKGNKFPVPGNILSFSGKNPFVTDTLHLLSQEVLFLSQEVFLVTWVYFIMGQVMFLLCVTWRIFSVTGLIFRSASSSISCPGKKNSEPKSFK